MVFWKRSSTSASSLALGVDVEVLGAGLVGGDERQVDLGLHREESSIWPSPPPPEALQGELRRWQVDALLLLNSSAR